MSRPTRLARQTLTSLRPLTTSSTHLAPLARSQRAHPVSLPSFKASRNPIPLDARHASSSTSTSTSEDPTVPRAAELIDKGNAALEEGDLEEARRLYKSSVEVKGTDRGWYNLGVCEYHLNNPTEAIEAWKKSIELEPSPDALANLASAYVLSKPPQPSLAITHMTHAMKLAPNDPEIAFNLAAILESTENLEPAMKLYEKALEGGIERAAQNVRSVSAKILAKRATATAAGAEGSASP